MSHSEMNMNILIPIGSHLFVPESKSMHYLKNSMEVLDNAATSIIYLCRPVRIAFGLFSANRINQHFAHLMSHNISMSTAWTN